MTAIIIFGVCVAAFVTTIYILLKRIKSDDDDEIFPPNHPNSSMY